MSRFAILRHDSPRGLHWDLLLETGDTLATWALPQVPEANVDEKKVSGRKRCQERMALSLGDFQRNSV
jgi:hypothetical protein